MRGIKSGYEEVMKRSGGERERERGRERGERERERGKWEKTSSKKGIGMREQRKGRSSSRCSLRGKGGGSKGEVIRKRRMTAIT